MSDFLEFLMGLLNVGDLISDTGEWFVSLFGRKTSVVVEFLVGLMVWIVGFALLVTASVMLTGK